MNAKYIYLLFVSLSMSIALNSQTIEVKEVSKKMSLGKNTALYLEIPGTDAKDVEKAWKKMIKDLDGKVTGPRKELLADDILLVSISTNTIDLYNAIDKTKDGSSMTVFFDLGGVFLNKHDHPGQFEVAANWLRSFALDMARSAAEDILAEEEKKLSKLQKEQENLVKEKGKLEDSIKKAEEIITKSKKKLEDNKKDLEDNTKAIEGQNKQVSEAKDRLNNIK